MNLEITPEPDATDRAAILAALAADEAGQAADSPWAEALLPTRDDLDVAP